MNLISIQVVWTMLNNLVKHWVTETIVAICAILLPLKVSIIAITVLMIADLVTGIMAAVKRGDKISSNRFGSTIQKFIIYNICLISGFVLEKYLAMDVFPLSKIMAGIVGMRELISVLENSSIVIGADIFKVVIEKLKFKANDKALYDPNDKA